MNLFSAPPLRASVGQDAGASPWDIVSISEGNSQIAVYSSATTKLPVWAYARQLKKTSFPFEIWLYLAMTGLPIYSVQRKMWTSAGKYVSQSGAPAYASLISTLDVSNGKVLKSGADKIFVNDLAKLSEVELTWAHDGDGEMGDHESVVNLSVDGFARTSFSPHDIYQSLSGSSLGLSFQDSKDLPKPPPIPEPPTALPKAAPAKSFPTGKWVVGGLVMGGLLWSLGRRP